MWRWPPTPSSAEVKERLELYIYSPPDLRGLLQDELYFTIYQPATFRALPFLFPEVGTLLSGK